MVIQVMHTNSLDDGDDDDNDQDHNLEDNEEYEEADDNIEEQVESVEVSLKGTCSVDDEELSMFDDKDGNGNDNDDEGSNKPGLEISNVSSIAISQEYQLPMVNSLDIQNPPTNDSPVSTPQSLCRQDSHEITV